MSVLGWWNRRRAQLLRYASASVVATITSQFVLVALLWTRTVSPGWANVWATAVGVVPSFVLNRRWVWGRRDRTRRHELVAFVALSAAGLALSTVAVAAVVGWADSLAFGDGARVVLGQAANLVAFGVVWVVQFFVLDRFLFGPHRSIRPEPVHSDEVGRGSITDSIIASAAGSMVA